MAFTDRYVRGDAAGGGNGTTNTNSGANGAWTMAEAITNEAAGIRMNVALAGGTIANAGTNRTAAAAGTTTAPVWWRGFNTTIGDCDLDDTLTKPLISWTTGRMIFSGAHHIVSSIRFVGTGNAANYLVSVSGGTFWGFQLQVDAQNAGASNGAVSIGTAAGGVWYRCFFKCTTTGPSVLTSSVGGEYVGCSAQGGGTSFAVTGSQAVFRRCVADTPVTNGFLCSSSNFVKIAECSAYTCVNGVNFTVLSAGNSVEDCIFSTCTTAINNTTGTNTNLVRRQNNSYWNCGATETGFGDSPAFGELTETADPFINAGGHNFTLVATALSKGTGTTNGLFENEAAYGSYSDRGAAQSAVGTFFFPVE